MSSKTPILHVRGKFLFVKSLLPIVLLLGSGAISHHWNLKTREHKLLRFNEYQNRILQDVRNVLHNSQMVLRGAAGVFASSDFVERHEWKAYHDYRNTTQTVPGIVATGFARVFSKDEAHEHVYSVKSEGLEHYHIWPTTTNDYIAPVVLLNLLLEQAGSWGLICILQPRSLSRCTWQVLTTNR